MTGDPPTPHDGDMPLKPCPFCGGEAEVIQYGTPRQSCRVACVDCGCHLESNENGAGYHWNRRMPVPFASDAWYKKAAELETGHDISAGGGDIDDFIFHPDDREEKET